MNNAILMVNSPDLNYYLYLFKTFFILLCITYIDYKVLNHEHASIKQKVCTFIFCVVLSIICSFIRFKFDFFYTIFTLYLLLSIYTSRLFHYSLTYSFLLTLLSIGLNYFILFLCIILNFILNEDTNENVPNCLHLGLLEIKNQESPYHKYAISNCDFFFSH